MDIPVKSAARPSKENFVYNDIQKNVWISPKEKEKIWRQHVTLVAKPLEQKSHFQIIKERCMELKHVAIVGSARNAFPQSLI